MKKIVFSLFMLFVYSIAYSQPLNMNDAKYYAEQWLTSAGQKSLTDLNCVYTQSNENSSLNYFYVFSSKTNNSYIIVSADERILPVLGYSDEGYFDPNNIPINMKSWLNGYVSEMNYIFTLDEVEKHPDWQEIENGNITRGVTAVAPLLGNMNWNQNSPYNYYCPVAAGGPGGKCYAGCAATAMSQIMKYWNYPPHGFGQSGYNSSYGYLSANYQNENYLWEKMPMQATSSNYDAIAKLMYHCGVSIKMNYSPSGSGGYPTDVQYALKTYFGYKPQCNVKDKEYYQHSVWENMMRAELDLGRPMEYFGYGPDGGHGFVLDGYNNSNLFHFNWGWSGSQNGYFSLSNLNPYPYTFTDGQGAIMSIEPRDDLFCAPIKNLIVEYTTNCDSAQLTWNAPEISELFTYNIYRDGSQIASNLKTTSFTDATFNSTEGHTWSVAAVCQSNSPQQVRATKPACFTFVPVSNILGIPTTATATLPLTLNGTVLPSSATNKTIIWSIEKVGTTNATITDDNILNITNPGTCVVKATIINGTSTGNYTKKINIVVSKATQLAPEAPTLAIVSNTSIELDSVLGCEYNINGGSYQTSNIFTNLSPNTLYTFTQRKAETKTHFASPASVEVQFATPLAINENLNNYIEIFPNPTSGKLIIDNGENKGGNPLVNVEILDVYGRKFPFNILKGWTAKPEEVVIKPRSGRSGEEGWQQQDDGVVIDLTGCPAGIYFLKITTETGIVTKKIIKN